MSWRIFRYIVVHAVFFYLHVVRTCFDIRGHVKANSALSVCRKSLGSHFCDDTLVLKREPVLTSFILLKFLSHRRQCAFTIPNHIHGNINFSTYYLVEVRLCKYTIRWIPLFHRWQAKKTNIAWVYGDLTTRPYEYVYLSRFMSVKFYYKTN